MKKIITLLLLLLLTTTNIFCQNSGSGSGYVLSHTIDCPAITSPEVIRFGTGVSGRVEFCMTVNNLKTTCGGGNNKNDQIYLYEDKNNDGVLELFVIWSAATPAPVCIITESTNGYIWVRFCGDGGCDASDMSGSTATVSWSTYTVPVNNLIANALNVNVCGASFVANNIMATSTENCDGYMGNTGPPSNTIVFFENNLDCNNTTSNGINPGSGENGGDVGYSVENDMWYKFCPGSIGTWVITLTKSSCYTPTSPQPTAAYGYQYSLFQGTPTNLGPLVSGGTAGQNNTGSAVINVVVTSTTNCYYLQIDGYGGTGCIFGFSLAPPAGGCLILPIELVSFDVHKYSDYNYITWVCATELNNDYFSLERSTDGINFQSIKIVKGAGTANVGTFYSYKDYSFNKNLYNYYRLKQVDYNGHSEYFNIIYVDNSNTKKEIIRVTNFMGIEIDRKSTGFIIVYYSDNTVSKLYVSE